MTLLLINFSSFSELSPGRLLFDLALLTSLVAYLLFWAIRLRRPPRSTALRATSTRQPAPDLSLDLADALFGVNARDRIVSANRRAESLFGYRPDELKDRSYQSLLFLPDGFSEEDSEPLKNADKLIGLEHEAWGLRKDGSRFRARVTVTPSRQGALRAVVAIRQIEAPAREAPAISTDPANWISPANRIRKFASLLGTSSRLSPVDRDYLRALQASTEDLHASLSLSRCLQALETRQLKAELQPLAIGPWLEQQSLSYRQEAAARGAHLAFPPFVKAELVVLTDESLLAQVYHALLDFALKTYQSPSLTLHLTHEQSLPGQPALPGPAPRPDARIPGGQNRRLSLLLIAAAPEQTPALLPADRPLLEAVEADPHVRLARQLVPLLGGDLIVDANDFSGLLFQFSLSCQAFGMAANATLPGQTAEPNAAAQESVAAPTPADSLPATPAKRPRTVLSIAEDADLKTWVREILVAEGFQVEECPPHQAIEKIRDGATIDLVVLQPDLQQEPDFDLTYEIRQFRNAEDMPILLVRTASQPHPEVDYFSAQAAIDFPAARSVLADKVISLWEHRAQA